MQSFRRDSVSRCFVKCKVRAVCFTNVVLLLASLCFLEVPWGVFEVSWGALECIGVWVFGCLRCLGAWGLGALVA